MRRQRQVWTLVLLGSAVVALILLAGVLPQLRFLPARPLPIGNLLQGLIPHAPEIASAPQSTVVLRVLITIVVWVLLPISVIALIVSADLRRELLKKIPIYISVAFVVYWLLRLLRAFMLSMSQQPQATGQSGEALDPSQSLFPTAPAFIADPPRWLVIALSAVVIALALLLLWSFRPRVRRKPQSLDLLVQEAQTALDELQAGGDVRDIIIRCYTDMSRVLREARGVTRKEAMTPREFEQMLIGLELRDEHIQQLTRLFERVRYSAAAPGEREQHEAEACLSAIVAVYRRSA